MTFDLWVHLGWLPNNPFVTEKCWINNKQVLVRDHSCSSSRSDIKNQSNSTPSFNVLATIRHQLIMEIQKPKTN